MKKRRGNIRNEFTDALNEEMLSRKILNKAAKNQRKEEQIFLAEDSVEEKISIPARTSENKTEENKISVEKKSAMKISRPELAQENLEADMEFEKRIFAEADNDFYDEEISEIGEHMRSKVAEKNKLPPTFHSTNIDNDLPDSKKIEEEFLPEPDADLYRKLTRAEVAGVGISAIMLIYSFSSLDKPLFFVSLSLLTHLLRPLIGALFGKHNRAVQNAMRSFSIVLFLGALLLLFI